MDMLTVGMYGKGNVGNLGKELSPEEKQLWLQRYQNQFALWCIMGSPLMLGCDIRSIGPEILELITNKGYRLGNVDATICAERPKINPHVPDMKRCLAEVMQTDEDNISIKATTTERLGFTGREEGISAYAVVLIEKP